MKDIPLFMVRDHMDQIPSFSCPGDYTIRTFVRGDERLWARIESLAGEFPDQDQALQRFEKDFGPFLSNVFVLRLQPPPSPSFAAARAAPNCAKIYAKNLC